MDRLIKLTKKIGKFTGTLKLKCKIRTQWTNKRKQEIDKENYKMGMWNVEELCSCWEIRVD